MAQQRPARIAIACAGLFLVPGATLIGTTYSLVSHVRLVQSSLGDPYAEAQAADWRDIFLASSLAGLALGTMLAAGLGWAVSGRVLRPLRAVTAAARAASRRTWASGWHWPGRPMS